jgi:hypothetical protein
LIALRYMIKYIRPEKVKTNQNDGKNNPEYQDSQTIEFKFKGVSHCSSPILSCFARLLASYQIRFILFDKFLLM